MQVSFNTCLNRETKYYGMKLTSLITGAIFGLLALIKFNFTVAIIGCVIGFAVGNYLAEYWYKGTFQRWCYWNLPTKLIAGKSLPNSSNRKLI